jgi:uncharacterized protein (DUF302 family)
VENEYGLGVATEMTFEQAVMRTRLVLRAQGFSILSEMPVPPRVGEGGRRHLFLGLWSRLIATGNLGGLGLDVGDHLQCNVVVFEDGGGTVVAALDPSDGMVGWDPSGLASEARDSLQRLLEEIASPVAE